MTRFIAILGLVGLLALGACAKKEPPPEPAPAETPTVASVTPPAASEAAAAPAPSASAAAADVPVEEDFEDEASLKVNSQTLDAQLDALEKEIKAN
ncbi:MAG TPA: hypothetical protein VNN72_11875 [Polyangiaceae bacterium]|nr:hypothetical protein [Polyangiaceae bacterium]